jgi:FRG domain
VPPYTKLRDSLKNYDGFSIALDFKGLPAYDLLIYTRHHGFPSPLLDWTRSAYIAAFFTFAAEHQGVKRRRSTCGSKGSFGRTAQIVRSCAASDRMFLRMVDMSFNSVTTVSAPRSRPRRWNGGSHRKKKVWHVSLAL